MKSIPLVLLVLALWSCTGHQSGHEVRQEIQMSDATDDVKIPIPIWELMEDRASVSAGSAAGHGGGEHGAPTSGPAAPALNLGATDKASSYIFSPIRVSLDEKNEGVLKKPNMDLVFARGGGTIDLADFATQQNGSFYLKFELAEEMKNNKDLHVFFVSAAKKRKINEEILGAGCNTFFDISKKFDKEFVKQAFKLNTTRDRHVSVLGGTFFFSVKKENQIYISQISFTDSKSKHLLCGL